MLIDNPVMVFPGVFYDPPVSGPQICCIITQKILTFKNFSKSLGPPHPVWHIYVDPESLLNRSVQVKRYIWQVSLFLKIAIMLSIKSVVIDNLWVANLGHSTATAQPLTKSSGD